MVIHSNGCTMYNVQCTLYNSCTVYNSCTIVVQSETNLTPSFRQYTFTIERNSRINSMGIIHFDAAQRLTVVTPHCVDYRG